MSIMVAWFRPVIAATTPLWSDLPAEFHARRTNIDTFAYNSPLLLPPAYKASGIKKKELSYR